MKTDASSGVACAVPAPAEEAVTYTGPPHAASTLPTLAGVGRVRSPACHGASSLTFIGRRLAEVGVTEAQREGREANAGSPASGV